jgi:hypothetical protein
MVSSDTNIVARRQGELGRTVSAWRVWRLLRFKAGWRLHSIYEPME